MKNLKYLLIIFIFFSCQQKGETKKITSDLQTDIEKAKVSRSTELVPEPDILDGLKSQKIIIDSLQSQNKLTLEVLVKEPNKEKLTIVLHENWPENIETTYNIWKHQNGNIMLIGEFPTSESGDWHIGYLHYFDKKKKTFAFQRNTNFFNSMCTNEVAYEKITEYYNSDFHRIERNYSLTDKNDKELKKDDCAMHYDYPFEVSNHLNSYLKKINYGS
ncbi:hypothetical protein LX95_00069 [Mesonia algae]|uniref:Lipoprotein n=1 Tax=Mesonia algae TaxID=213248 RepID=A0A2W7IF54_9FLAO|nr:hypothetical protein [Mesonia algae]PZW43745.1 hypothetical protein LX95_00069 [Mesonia algae]